MSFSKKSNAELKKHNFISYKQKQMQTRNHKKHYAAKRDNKNFILYHYKMMEIGTKESNGDH